MDTIFNQMFKFILKILALSLLIRIISFVIYTISKMIT